MADSKGQRLLLFDLDESIRYSKFDNSVEGVAPSPKPKPKEDSTKLSMMIGVFLPCILAIFSGILFLRLGEIFLRFQCVTTVLYFTVYCVTVLCHKCQHLWLYASKWIRH